MGASQSDSIGGAGEGGGGQACSGCRQLTLTPALTLSLVPPGLPPPKPPRPCAKPPP